MQCGHTIHITWLGSEKVVIGMAAIESSIIAAKVFFILDCLGSVDMALLCTLLPGRMKIWAAHFGVSCEDCYALEILRFV